MANSSPGPATESETPHLPQEGLQAAVREAQAGMEAERAMMGLVRLAPPDRGEEWLLTQADLSTQTEAE